MIRSRRLASLVACLLAVRVLAPVGHAQQASSVQARSGSKIWVARYAEMEEYLRTAECVVMEELGSGAPGARRCVFRPGGLVSRMLWKPLPPGFHRGFWESYKAEIAAYELDKLLKTDMVPPAVERELQGHKGAGILWVENTSWKPETPPIASDRAKWEKQLVRMRMFDNLIGNKARNRANMLSDPALNLILVDHSRAFEPSAELPHTVRPIDEAYWGRMRTLTRKQLDAALGHWLDDDQIKGIIDRREKMKAEIDRLPRR